MVGARASHASGDRAGVCVRGGLVPGRSPDFLPNSDAIDGYLSELRRCLRVSWWTRARILAEVRAHLSDTAQEYVAQGFDAATAKRQAVARLGSPAEMASKFPPASMAPAIAAGGFLVTVALIAAAVVSPSVGESSDWTQVRGSKPLPTKAWATHCVASWNAPAKRRYRHVIADGGPFGYPVFQRYVGVPVVSTFGYSPPFRGGHTARSIARVPCFPVVTFRKGRSVMRLAFRSLEPEKPSPVSLHPSGHYVTIRTKVMSNGRFAFPRKPPRPFGVWGGRLTLTVTLLSPERIHISSSRTCIRYNVAVNRSAELLTQTNVPSRPPRQTRVAAGVTETRHSCFDWGRHQHHPLHSVLRTRTSRRAVEVFATDPPWSVFAVATELKFRIVERPATRGRRISSPRWDLVYVNHW